jgi:spore maturation protein SpmA
MLLNRIFIGMFVIAFVVAFSKLVFWGDVFIFEKMVNGLFDAAKNGFEIALYLTGALCLWMGFMEVGEKGGAVRILSKAVAPLFRKLFPEVPSDHPAVGSIMMNFSANMLGLDNAATPLGLKAMTHLQELNPNKETASNAQIMFLVLNTSGLTIIPVSILAMRATAGSASPSEVFIPILFATFFSSLVGLIYVSIRQKINLLNRTVLLYIGSVAAFVIGLLYYVSIHPEHTKIISSVGGNVILMLIILLFFGLAIRKKVNVYDSFIEGAKGGFQVAINIVPYLVGILAAIAVFRSSGAFDAILDGLKTALIFMGVTALEFIDALPVAFMKPFSGSGARALMLEVFDTHGVDSFAGKLAATFQGSTETTFYILTVYFGSVNIKNARYAAGAGLLADLAGMIASIIIAYIFFSHA